LSSQNSKELPYFIESQLTIAKNLVQQAGTNYFAGMRRHDSHAAVAMLEGMMAALDTDHFETGLGQCRYQVRSGVLAGCGSCRNADPLDAYEFENLFRRSFHLKAQFDRLSNAFPDLVQGPRLSVAPWQLRDRSHVISVFVAFNNHIKLALQLSVLAFYSRPICGPLGNHPLPSQYSRLGR
jgi:hypothetical protein